LLVKRDYSTCPVRAGVSRIMIFLVSVGAGNYAKSLLCNTLLINLILKADSPVRLAPSLRNRYEFDHIRLQAD
jgi:hypothetical protein